jgi:hypothetical protein
LQQDRLQNTVDGRFSLIFASCDFQNKERAAGFSLGFEAVMPDSFTGRRCELLQDPAPCGHKKTPRRGETIPTLPPRTAQCKRKMRLCNYFSMFLHIDGEIRGNIDISAH